MKKIILTSLMLIFVISVSLAQWTQPTGTTLATTNSVTIGTGTNPGYRLYIATPGTLPVGIGGNDSTTVGGDLNLIRTNSGYGLGRSPSIQFQDNLSGHAVMIQGAQGQLQFFNYNTGWTERMRISLAGNLLIGKTSQVNSAYKLDVNGSVRANQVTVNTTGADFVFAPAYKLYPLAGLKNYIDQNHHLPGIAPAAQMQADGLNLGENQTKLLQKVEELTLYMIEKDRQVKEEQAVNKRQQALLLKLQQRVEAQQKEIDQLKTKN